MSVSLHFRGLGRYGAYRSIIVIIGQIRAPATAALAASAANLNPKLRVFHCLSEFIVGFDMAATVVRVVSGDIVKAN